MKIFDLFKKPLDSVSDEITTKFRTPFFSTFLIIWVIRNNKFIYDLFFNSIIEDKTDVLAVQFNISEWSFYTRNLKLIGLALLVILFYYLIINLSRIITMISEERIKINLLSYFKSKSISTKEDVDFWKNRAEEFKRKNNELESELSVVRMGSDTYKNKIKKADEEIDNLVKNSKGRIRNISSNIKGRLNNLKYFTMN